MFYIIEVEDHVRVAPKLFGYSTPEAVAKQLNETYIGKYDREMGQIIEVIEVTNVTDGTIIPGDGAAYYFSEFKLLVWKPELHELVFGEIEEITNFGAFINMGVREGMIHIGQTMDDYVSFSKQNSLLGKSTKRNLKQGDLCLARIVAISFRKGDLKMGLTMRQPGLGKLEWIQEDKQKKELEAKKVAKAEEKASKGGKK